MNKLILFACILLQLLTKIQSVHQNENAFAVGYVNDKNSQNFQNGPQSAQYTVQQNNHGPQNPNIKILDHYYQSTPGTPTIQTIYQSTTPSSQLNDGNFNQKQNLSPTVTLHSSHGVNNLQNNNAAAVQQYAGGQGNSAKYLESPGSDHPGYEITTVSPGYGGNTIQTSSSSESSESSSKSSSSSSSSISTTVNPSVSIVHSGSPFQYHGNQDQSLVNQGHINYDLGHGAYASSSIPPVEVHSFGPPAGVQLNGHGSSGLVSTTSAPHILVSQGHPGVSTTSSTSFNENSHDSSNSHSYNSAVMSVTPTPYTISVSNPQPYGISHATGPAYLPPPAQPKYFVPAIPTISTSSNLHTVAVPSPPPTVLVPTIPPHVSIPTPVPVHPQISTTSVHNIPVVTDVPVTQFQEHHGVITKTVKVAEPGIKKQTYEIRRPAIQKQFYDIEERVVVRPAGSVVVEIDHPISKTSKGSVTVPGAGGGISHGEGGIVTSHGAQGGVVNIGGHSSNNHGVYSSSSQGIYSGGGAAHFPYFTGYYPNICEQYNQHLTTNYNPQYAHPPAHFGSEIPSTTIKPIVEHTTAAYTNSPDDDTVVIEPKSQNTKSYNEKYTDVQNNPTPSPVNQAQTTDRPTPFMISVGDPDFNYPPYAPVQHQNEINSHPRSDLHNVGAHTLYTMQNMINNQYFDPNNNPSNIRPVQNQHVQQAPQLRGNYVHPGQQNAQYSQNIPPHQNSPLILHTAQPNPRSNVQFEQYNQAPVTHQNQQYYPSNRVSSNHPNQQTFQAYSINPNYQNEIPYKFNAAPNQQNQRSQAYTVNPNFQSQPFQSYNFRPNNPNQFSQAYTVSPNHQNAVSHSPQAYSFAFYNRNNPQNQLSAYKQFPEGGQIIEQPSNLQFNPNNVQNNNLVRVPLGGIQYYQPPTVDNTKTPGNNQNYQASNLNEPSQQSNNLPQPQIQIRFNDSSEYPKVDIQSDSLEPSTNDTDDFARTNQMIDSFPDDQINDEENASDNDQDVNNAKYSTEEYDSDRNNSDIRGDISFNKDNGQPNNSTNNLQFSARYENGPSVNIDYQPKDNNQKKIVDFILNNRDHYSVPEHVPVQHPDTKSHVISAVPASKHAEPAGERVHTRRIVVNQPIETVQIVEEQIPFTNYKQVVIQQPTVYKTANVGLKRIETSVPVYVQHTTPTYYDYNQHYGHYGHH